MGASLLTIAVLVLSASHCADALTQPSFIEFVDNGYSGVTVAIHNQVAESEVLIERIQYMFTEASKYLYQATRNRAYFKEVTILVPKTWTSKPEYELPGGITFDNADVIVAPPNPRWAPLQYTKQYEGCGKQGVHIHFLDAFLTDPNTETYYGPIGRMLVHEWAHYRWGLFDEYPDPVGDPDNYQEFYYSPFTQKFEGVRCSYNYNARPLVFLPESLSYRDCAGDEYIGYEDGCVFYILVDQNDVTSSIMFGTYPLEPITNFCDDTEEEAIIHNREAPNKHNRLCSRVSNWGVMASTDDFRGDNNPPSEISEEDLLPSFRIVQHKEARVVLLLDTSGSMNNDNKFIKMISSSANFLSSIVIDGSLIGIVEFNTGAIILQELITVNGDDDRVKLLNSLPKRASGFTTIGQGLLESIQVLSLNQTDPKGGIIMLISDGEENHGSNDFPYVADVMNDVIASGVIVDTLAFSQDASSLLPNISRATGGKTFFYSNEPGSNTLYEAFASTMERGDVRDADKRVQLQGTSWYLEGGEDRTNGVFMDRTLGNKTEFSFSWTKEDVQAIEVTIKRPNGTTIDSSYDGYGVDTAFRTLRVIVQGQAEEGAWEFTVLNTLPSSEEVAIAISSYPSSDDVDPIIVTSELSGSITDFERGEPLVAYAEVRQGFNPMIYANVSAIIERPNAKPVILQLLDNGAGADITKNDGVYSRSFTEFTEVGYYGIRINVDNNNGEAIIINSVAFSKARPIVDPDKAFDLPEIGGIKIPAPGAPPAEPTGEPAPAFSRGISGGSSRVETVPDGFTPGDDVFPPGDVLDLRVQDSSFQNETVTLTWTAPGDDLDNGAASRYELIRAESIQAWQNDSTPESHLILNSSLILQGDLTSPQEFGNQEEFVVRAPVPEGASVASYAFVLRAFDDSGNPSGFSNAVQAVLREYIPQPPEPPVTAEPLEGLEGWEIALIVIGSVAAALLIAVGVVAVFKAFKSKKVKEEQPAEKEMDKKDLDGKAYQAYA